MIVTVPKIQNRIVLNYLPIMLWRDLVLMVLIVAFLAKIHLLSKTVNITLLVLTFLTLYNVCFLMLLLLKWKLDQVVRQSLCLLEYLQPMLVYLILLCLFFKQDRVKPLWGTECLGLWLCCGNARVTFSGANLNYQQLVVLLSVNAACFIESLNLSNYKLKPTLLWWYLEAFLAHSLNSVWTVVLWPYINFVHYHTLVLLLKLWVHVWVDHAIHSFQVGCCITKIQLEFVLYDAPFDTLRVNLLIFLQVIFLNV